MIQEPDFGSLMPDTFVDLGNDSYGGSVDDYQSRVDDFDLRGPNAQYLPSSGFEGLEGEEGEPEDDCCTELSICQSENAELEEQIAVICEKFVPPNGTFKYYELNSSRVGDYRTYSYSVGSLELRPETITSPFDKKIEWTESANINYSYDLQISTNTVSYNGPRVSIGASDIIVKNPAGSIVTSINTLSTGTYTVLVNFSANLGNKYPAPDYFPIGEFTISQTAPDDLPNSDTVIGYTDYGCP